MWEIIKGAASFLFGGSTAAKDVIDTGTKMADNAFFTDQEKSVASQKVLDWYLKYQTITTPQNKARRILAFEICTLWVVLVFIAVICWPFAKDYSKFILGVLENVVNKPFLMIMGFYFLVHLVRGTIDKVKGNS